MFYLKSKINNDNEVLVKESKRDIVMWQWNNQHQ